MKVVKITEVTKTTIELNNEEVMTLKTVLGNTSTVTNKEIGINEEGDMF